MKSSVGRIEKLQSCLQPFRLRLREHALYRQMDDVASIAAFMEHHVFAVWDFMSLLKALQRVVTCVDLPWRPVGPARTRRFINEIVLEEESDIIEGVETGHFEFYLRAMRQAGASTAAIDRLIGLLDDGVALDSALDLAYAPDGAAAFVRSTFDAIKDGRAHVIAACFTFGREDSIGTMFENIARVVGSHADELSLFSTYLERHLQLYGEEHGPMAISLICDLCGEDEQKWEEATMASIAALTHRLALWDSISATLLSRPGAAHGVPHPATLPILFAQAETMQA